MGAKPLFCPPPNNQRRFFFKHERKQKQRQNIFSQNSPQYLWPKFLPPQYLWQVYAAGSKSVHPSLGNDAFPSLFQISSLFPKNLSNSVENCPNFTFSEKKSRFSSAKIFDDLFFSHRPQIFLFPLYFHFFSPFPPFQRKSSFPPTLPNFPSDFVKCPCFLHTFCDFRFPPTLTMMHLCIT